MTDEIGDAPPWRGPRPGGPVDGRRTRSVPPARPPGGRRRWSQVSVLGLLALLLGYAVTHRPPAPAPRPNRVHAALPPRPAGSPVQPWLGGRASTGPAGLRLLVSGANPRIVDAATGVATAPAGFRLVPGMGVAAFPLGRSKVAVVQYAWAAGSYLLLPGADPQILGRQSSVSRGADGGLIIVSSPRGRTIVSVIAADPRVRREWTSPDGLAVLGDTPFGLVLQRSGRSAVDRDLMLVDRESGAPRRVLDRVRVAVAAGDRAAAWVPADCTDPCPLAVGDLRTGARRDYPMPDGRRPDSGAFSPDGRRLALTFPRLTAGPDDTGLADTGPADTGPAGTGPDGTGPDGTGRVGVLDLKTGAVALVPDLRTAPDLGAHLAWSSDSRWLVIGVPWPDHQAIALWQPGGALRVLPTELPGRAGPLTVLP